MCIIDNNSSAMIVNEADKSRLPATVVPKHYDITIEPDLHNFTFSGTETISLQVKQPVTEIVLNAAELAISAAHLIDANGSRLNGQILLDEANELATINFNGIAGKGKWQLTLEFSGILNNKLHGFYRSTYKDEFGREHVIASTQCEPNDARRVFPCWDEPAFKATFSVALVVDKNLTAISNGNAISQTPIKTSRTETRNYNCGREHNQTISDEKKLVKFGKTPKMSTYLVLLAVGEFEHSETIICNSTPITIYHRPGKSSMTEFALSMAAYSLDWLEKYTGIPYMGDKLDLIAIPDFAFGAMENLGAITFRETALLVDTRTATLAELARVAEVVAHENVHQWFGDLVTMKWWDGLWLNEAFATFMATKIENDFRPQWDRWTNFAIERAAALRTDGLAATRSIQAPVSRAADALGMIDVITYRKGCSVLRQLEQFIGEEAFRQGIATYLQRHAYGNAETNDLWDALDSVTTLPARAVMDSWIYQPGYPVINVNKSSVQGTIKLTQSRFKYLQENHSQTEELWLAPVHLRYKTDKGITEKWVLLKQNETNIYLGENLEWVVANAGGHCFHRTSYAPALATALTQSGDAALSAIERFNLLNDAWACVQAGLVTSVDYLQLIGSFSNETDPNVWSIISTSLSRLLGILPETQRPELEQLVRTLAMPTLKRLGWQSGEQDSAQDKQLRSIIIALLGTSGSDARVQKKAKRLFSKYTKDKASVPGDLVPALVSLVAYTGDNEQYANFQQLAAATNVPQEQVRFIGALAGFRQKELLEKTLAATISPTVRSQDASSLLIRLLSNEVIAEDAWAFIKANWDCIVANFPETGLISMVSGIAALDKPHLETDVREFFASHPIKGGEKAVAQALEQLRIAVLFNERESAVLNARFRAETLPERKNIENNH